MKQAIVVLVAVVVAGCHHAPATPAPQGPGARRLGSGVRRDAKSFSDFVPLVASTDSGGECSIEREPKVTTATASYPGERNRAMLVAIAFDSVGTLVKYTEIRGFLDTRTSERGAARDSVLRARVHTMQRFSVQIDYPVDHVEAMNMVGGQPTYRIVGHVAQFDTLSWLGLLPRLERVRQLCAI